MKKCGIYCIENKTNGKKYIGKSKNIQSRFNTHRHLLGQPKFKGRCNRHLWYSVQIHGLDNFDFWVVEELPSDDELLARREEYWMEFYNSYDGDFGYNIIKVSTITKYTEEHCARISEALKGRPRTPEELHNLSEAHKGYITPESSKEKLRLANTKYSYERYDKSMNLLATYATQKDLRNNKISMSKVTECSNGVRKTHLKHYWRKIPFVGLDVAEKFGGVIDPKDWRYAEPIDTPPTESV